LLVKARKKGMSPTDSFVELNEFTGYEDKAHPPFIRGGRDLDALRKGEQWYVGAVAAGKRKHLGDEKALAAVAAWSHLAAPNSYRL
jgi:hypothetical protein